MKTTIPETRAAFPDLTLEVVAQIAEGDTVASRWRGTMSPAGNGEPLGGSAGSRSTASARG